MLQAQQCMNQRYQLIRLLGKTPVRQTWLAEDVTTQDAVVVKLLVFSDQMQWDNLKLFEREAQVLQQLHHPQIPKYRDFFRLDEQILWFCLVQDYIPAVSWKQRLERGKWLTEAEGRSLAHAVLQILVYLHGLSPPVIHRNIKPSNLLLGNDQQIYLIDFGAVQDRAAAEEATFTVVGTYGYAPLEQLGGRAVPASDLYTLGATLMHLLTGIPPADLLLQSGRLQVAGQVNLNPGFVRWLERLTDPSLESRFATAQAAIAALEENEMAIQAIAPARPDKSKIQLKKSSDRLEIVLAEKLSEWEAFYIIPTIGLAGYSLYLYSGEFYRTGWWLPILWLLITAGSITYAAVRPGFARSCLQLDQRTFAIEWRFLGICLWRQTGQVREIEQAVEAGSEIMLVSGIREYFLKRHGTALTEAECRWLAAEIRQWLGLK